MNQLQTRIHRVAALLLALCLLPAMAVRAQSSETAPTDGKERWMERTYGVSLLPPAGTRELPGKPNSALGHFTKPDRYTISVFIRRIEGKINQPKLIDAIREQVATAYPSAREFPRLERAFEIKEKPGWTVYYLIPDPKRGDFVIGQSIWLIDDRTFVVVRMEADHKFFDASRDEYEKAVATLDIMPFEEIRAMRQQQIEAGQRLLDKIDNARLADALIPEQWLRVLDHGRDVGYMRIRQSRRRDQKLKSENGFVVDVDARMRQGGAYFDTKAGYFISEDTEEHVVRFKDENDKLQQRIEGGHRAELWSHRVTQRPVKAPRNQTERPPLMSWAETGVRGYTELVLDGRKRWINRLTVTRETRAGHREHQWDTPKDGYLSLVEQHLLGRLVPNDDPRQFAFYAYSPITGEINFRSDRVEPQIDGSYKIYTRPSLDSEETVRHYNKSGTLISRTDPDGREWRPATFEQIKAIWQLR